MTDTNEVAVAIGHAIDYFMLAVQEAHDEIRADLRGVLRGECDLEVSTTPLTFGGDAFVAGLKARGFELTPVGALAEMTELCRDAEARAASAETELAAVTS